MNKEEQMLQKRLIELSELSYRRDIVTFSDFLNLNELNILHTTPRDMLSSRYETFGGYEPAERQMAAFLPDALYYEYRYPISVIRITPANRKFAEDLTHRDFLGGILHLGIERSCLGDLLVDDSACHDRTGKGTSSRLVNTNHQVGIFIFKSKIRHNKTHCVQGIVGEIQRPLQSYKS